MLWVPKGGPYTSGREKGVMFNAVSGVRFKEFWKIRFYIEGKYIYSSKTRNNVQVIDFSNFGAVAGISFDFGKGERPL